MSASRAPSCRMCMCCIGWADAGGREGRQKADSSWHACGWTFLHLTLVRVLGGKCTTGQRTLACFVGVLESGCRGPSKL